MSTSHFLYPLNPTTDYRFKDDRGNEYLTSVEGFFDCYADQPSAEWLVHHGINDLQPKDFVWVHFALPVSAIMAVGRVRKVPHLIKELDRYAIWIDWDWKLTKQLQARPIPYSAHKQRVQASVIKANPKTQKVIDKWLKDPKLGHASNALKPIKFKQILVEQRQGQGQFRHALMVAYNYRCAVTGCDVRDTLQAAHIVPVSKNGQHQIKNGILLRADIHNLFDRGLLTIDEKYTVRLHRSIQTSVIYKSLHGRKLAVIPNTPTQKPSLKNLALHRKFHLTY